MIGLGLRQTWNFTQHGRPDIFYYVPRLGNTDQDYLIPISTDEGGRGCKIVAF